MYGYGLVLVDRYALTTAMCEYGCEVKHVLDLNPLMPSCITLARPEKHAIANQRTKLKRENRTYDIIKAIEGQPTGSATRALWVSGNSLTRTAGVKHTHSRTHDTQRCEH